METYEKIVEVGATIEEVFRALGDFQSYPRWMHNVTRVTPLAAGDELEWHGVASADSQHGGLRWVTRTTHYEPDRRIAWRTIGGDVNVECEVVLQETKRGTTLVRMLRNFDQAGDTSADAAAIAEYQKLCLEEDSTRFQHYVESVRTRLPETEATAQTHGATARASESELPMASDEARKIFRRGVDRLLDDAPSKDWTIGK